MKDRHTSRFRVSYRVAGQEVYGRTFSVTTRDPMTPELAELVIAVARGAEVVRAGEVQIVIRWLIQ